VPAGSLQHAVDRTQRFIGEDERLTKSCVFIRPHALLVQSAQSPCREYPSSLLTSEKVRLDLMPSHDSKHEFGVEEQLILVSSVVELLSRVLTFVPDRSAAATELDAEMRETILTAQFALVRWRLARGIEAGLISINDDQSITETP
jgi:hypothetical protein